MRRGVAQSAIRCIAALACATALALGTTSAEARGLPELVQRALDHLGVPYRYGGDDPARGFDCSGLVRHVFRSALGMDLPRRAEEMGRIGEAVERDALAPGDLVFFNTLGRPFSHVAIYIGEGRFVHAPAARGRVRVEALEQRYWQARFNGARRVATASDGARSTPPASADPATAPPPRAPEPIEDPMRGA